MWISVPCSCGGTNENCYHCSGLGEYYTPANYGWRVWTADAQGAKEEHPATHEPASEIARPEESATVQDDLTRPEFPSREVGHPNESESAEVNMSAKFGRVEECPQPHCGLQGTLSEVHRHLEWSYSGGGGKTGNQDQYIERMHCPLCSIRVHRADFEPTWKSRTERRGGLLEQFVLTLTRPAPQAPHRHRSGRQNVTFVANPQMMIRTLYLHLVNSHRISRWTLVRYRQRGSVAEGINQTATRRNRRMLSSVAGTTCLRRIGEWGSSFVRRAGMVHILCRTDMMMNRNPDKWAHLAA